MGFKPASEALYPVAPIGVHGFLHAQWAVPGSPYNLLDNSLNVFPVAFWRLHGWIDDVWERLRDPNEIFSEWKQLLQKWSIHAEKVELLKRECPDERGYRSLRTAIRTYQPEQQA